MICMTTGGGAGTAGGCAISTGIGLGATGRLMGTGTGAGGGRLTGNTLYRPNNSSIVSILTGTAEGGGVWTITGSGEAF